MKKKEALDILGLVDNATDEDIKRAHRQKIREHHPDRFTDPTQKAAAEEQTKLINEARDVLVSHTWEPEFGPRAAARPAGTSSQDPYASQYDPFYGVPFTYVWTSWDNIGADPQNHTGQEDPFSRAFDAFNSVFTQVPRKTAREQYEESRKELRSFTLFVALKIAVLAFSAVVGGLATGMFIYMILTVLAAISREVQGCSSIFVVPFVIFFGFPIILMMPSLGASVSTGLLVFFAIAVIYDLGTIRQIFSQMRTFKQKADIEQ